MWRTRELRRREALCLILHIQAPSGITHMSHPSRPYACVKNKAQIRPARLTPAAIFRPLWPAKVRPGIGVQFEAMVKMLELDLP